MMVVMKMSPFHVRSPVQCAPWALLLALAACGGGQGETREPEQPEPILLAQRGEGRLPIERPLSESAPQPAEGFDCINYTRVVRYGNHGYDHWVELESKCSEAARCTVKTNANPSGERAVVEPSATIGVLTFRGSPAREFSAQVRCEPVKAP